MQEQTIFDLLYPKFKIDKPIRTIELFAGYGSTRLAWKYLGIEVESWFVSEWAVKSILAYKNLHESDNKNDYTRNQSKAWLVDRLFEAGISSNYNEPMTKEQIERLQESQLRDIYNAMVITKNKGNIQKIKGLDLNICDTDIYIYMLVFISLPRLKPCRQS